MAVISISDWTKSRRRKEERENYSVDIESIVILYYKRRKRTFGRKKSMAMFHHIKANSKVFCGRRKFLIVSLQRFSGSSGGIILCVASWYNWWIHLHWPPHSLQPYANQWKSYARTKWKERRKKSFDSVSNKNHEQTFSVVFFVLYVFFPFFANSVCFIRPSEWRRRRREETFFCE